MSRVEYLKNILLEEYGISTDKELERAIQQMPKINIGVFTTQIKGKFEKGERKGA